MASSSNLHIYRDEHPDVSLNKCLEVHSLTIKDDNGNYITVFATKAQLEIMRETIDGYLKSLQEPCAE